MRKFAIFLALPAVLAAVLVGCGGNTGPTKENTKDSAAKAAAAGKADKTADDAPGLKELDEADRKLAEKQKFCPKTGELLGSMGKPYKILLKDRVVFLCCDGCEEAVTKDPERYLKKLDELLAKK